MMRLVAAAALAKIPVSTLRQWVYDQRLTSVKKGWVIYVTWSEVCQIVEWQHARRQHLPKCPSRLYDGVTSPALSTEASPAVDSTPMSGARSCKEA
jgi:hypothetical protein